MRNALKIMRSDGGYQCRPSWVDEKRIENNDGLAGRDGIVRLLRGPRMA